jgi:hypothetical protein
MQQLNNGNWLPEDEAKELAQELYYQRAVQAYLMTLPYMNTIGMRDGIREICGDGYHILPIWKTRMDANAWIPTPNADVIYAIGFLDLKKTGPLVVYAPPNVIGMFTDVQQNTITDVGLLGPDQAKGGLYLLLPPSWAGEVPKGYFSFQSKSNNVFLFFRTVMPPGEDGPDPKPAVELAEQTRVYRLWQEEKDSLNMEFPDLSGKRVHMMYPTDFSYWEKLKALIDAEAYGFMIPENRGLLAVLGIVRDQPFEPTADEKKLLEKAVEMAPRMLLAQRQTMREDKRELYYHDRNYVRVWAGGTNDWMQESYLDIDMRARFFQVAFSSAPAMVMRTVGAGSKYPQGLWDDDGNYLNGSHTYKLHLPPRHSCRAVLGRDHLQHHRWQHGKRAGPTVPDDQRHGQTEIQRRRLHRSLFPPRETRWRGRQEFHQDRHRARLHVRHPLLWHAPVVLRPNMEAGQSGENQVGSTLFWARSE